MSDNQNTFATLGDPVGIVTKLSGSVTVQSIDGQARELQIGDQIYFAETILTGTNASVTIAFVDGTEVVIGGDSIVEINEEVYNPGSNDELVEDATAEAEALQAAILAGDDPTLVQDAPAAGDTAEQDRVDVSIDRNNSSVQIGFGNDTDSSLPTYGYDTDNGSSSLTTQVFSIRSTDDSSSATAAVAGVVTVDDITSDDEINASEAQADITVSGTAIGGDIATGDLVSMTINDVVYETAVNSDGSWSVDVDAADLVADTEFEVVVTSSNDSGNVVESIGQSTHTVDQTALLVNLDIDFVTVDAIVNGEEADGIVTLTGSVTGDDFESGVVTLTINDVVYETEVGSDGMWSVDVAGADLQADADSEVQGSVVVTNNIGQEGVASTTESYSVDTVGRATIQVNSITSDDVLNAEESEGSVTVSGRVGFDASAGDQVSMTVNGVVYTATVLANKTWSVEVAGSDLAAETSFTVSVTGQDDADNTFTATTISTHTVDLAATAGTVTVADITEDDVINATESGQTIAVTG
ncbi:MAG: retention module-containing protein, partial [Marinomonas sp.]